MGASATLGEVTYKDWDQPPHSYFERTPTDRFSRLKAQLESGAVSLDRTSEKGFLHSLLKLLAIPASSQMLVFSTTSLQLNLINPSNPRALYFNEDIYLGFIPGGRIEIVSLDPELGGIFYIFDIPKDGGPIRIDRSTRCMNCHAGSDTGYVPGLTIKSVVPASTGGSLDSFRRELTGHGIPLTNRFGGWYVTGAGNFTNHWGNLVGDLTGGVLTTTPVSLGARFNYDRYLVTSSDLLPQLVHEHQAGFVNRVVEATYRARTYQHTDPGGLTTEHREELDRQAHGIVRYLLFSDEAPLPPGGVTGDEAFKADFLRTRRVVHGASLKDLDLNNRLLKFRCSYMIYSPVFLGLPEVVKRRVYEHLGHALDENEPNPEYKYLTPAEKRVIRQILRETLTDLPAGW
ncbi:MAG TPA: hypothetical protein DCE44_07465 [Verrucomicrobiales bacterium]|nr:hypothetical protein [Verrucomicrobiales bacterium]